MCPPRQYRKCFVELNALLFHHPGEHITVPILAIPPHALHVRSNLHRIVLCRCAQASMPPQMDPALRQHLFDRVRLPNVLNELINVFHQPFLTIYPEFSNPFEHAPRAHPPQTKTTSPSTPAPLPYL